MMGGFDGSCRGMVGGGRAAGGGCCRLCSHYQTIEENVSCQLFPSCISHYPVYTTQINAAPNQCRWTYTQTCRFWIGPSLGPAQWTIYLRGSHTVVPRTGTPPRCLSLFCCGRRMECRMHLCRNGHRLASFSR